MQVKEEYPPNFAEIKQHFDCDKYQPIFAYGDTIFNPYKIQIPEDIKVHEEVHCEQQKQYTSPNFWWNKYLLDREFRAKMETEAFFYQCEFVKNYINNKAYNECLDECAHNLSSSLYGLGMNFYQARTKIRKYDF